MRIPLCLETPSSDSDQDWFDKESSYEALLLKFFAIIFSGQELPGGAPTSG